MSPLRLASALTLSLLLAGASASMATAGPVGGISAVDNAATMAESYVWFDGDSERTVWVNRSLVAEFDPAPTVTTVPSAKAVIVAGDAVAGGRGVRFWKVAAGSTRAEAVASISAGNFTGRYSPVLHDGASEARPKRALPGNVVVHLDRSWDNAAVGRWASAQGVEVVKSLAFAPNVFLVRSAPGLVSLETANRLYRSNTVVAAYPVWWREVGHR